MNGFSTIVSRYFKAIGLAMMSLACASCATLAPSTNNNDVAKADNTQSRAERVFLYQSRVADSLLDHYPLMEIFEAADPSIIAAEARMTESCSPLTRAVLSHLEGREPSLGLRFQVFASIGECEHWARKIESLLDSSAADSSSQTI